MARDVRNLVPKPPDDDVVDVLSAEVTSIRTGNVGWLAERAIPNPTSRSSKSHTGRLPESRRSISEGGEDGFKSMTGAPVEHTADDEETPVADVRPGDTNSSALGGEAGGRARTSSVGGGNTA